MTKQDKRVVQRYFSPDLFNKNVKFQDFKKDIADLIDKIKTFEFEYDFEIREDYFNLYYRGNSIGKVEYRLDNAEYKIRIHDKFIHDDETKKPKARPFDLKKTFKCRNDSDGYFIFTIPRNKFRSFYSSQNLKSMAMRVKENNFQEEPAFEQLLITGNLDRDDFVIIDRQVMDGSGDGTKIDMLALARKVNSNDYQFCVVEIKLGNNKELASKVYEQLKGYVERVEKYFQEYSNCYKENLRQKKELGLFAQFSKIQHLSEINIVKPVLGMVVVGGYPRIAKKHIDNLMEKVRKQNAEIKVQQIDYKIDYFKKSEQK